MRREGGMSGWKVSRCLSWSSELKLDGVGWSVCVGGEGEEEGGQRRALWHLLLKQVEWMSTLRLARNHSWGTKFPFPPHLMNHFNNVCISQKSFWKHVDCVGGILESKEEFFLSDQKTRKCLKGIATWRAREADGFQHWSARSHWFLSSGWLQSAMFWLESKWKYLCLWRKINSMDLGETS